MKHRLSHINFNHIDLPEIFIHSSEMGEYLLEVDDFEHRGYVYDEQDKLVKFKNITQIKQALNECRVGKAYLVQQSAYEEMCGHDELGGTEMKMELNFKH